MDGDVHLPQRVDELDRGREVRLVRRDDVAARIAQFRLPQRGPRLGIVRRKCVHAGRRRRPRVLAPSGDRALPHLEDVEQQVLAVARRVVDHRAIERHRVIDRLFELPFLRRDRVRVVAIR